MQQQTSTKPVSTFKIGNAYGSDALSPKDTPKEQTPFQLIISKAQDKLTQTAQNLVQGFRDLSIK